MRRWFQRAVSRVRPGADIDPRRWSEPARVSARFFNMLASMHECDTMMLAENPQWWVLPQEIP